jgi:nitrogen fixation protein FixH
MSQIMPRKQFTGSHMAFIIVSFFAVVFTVNATLAISAYRSWTGLVIENSYVASQSFDADTERLMQARAGMSHKLHYQNGRLQLDLFLADGSAVQAMDVKIALGRPADNAQDTVLQFIPESQGRYVINTKISRGIWTGIITAKVTGRADLVLPFRLNVEESN